jgi:quercetin dioxygenase-like cupin family protein
MKRIHHEEAASSPVVMEGASGCTVRWLVGKDDGAPNFAMREFAIAPGGHTPRHSHPYEHEIYVLEGEGVVVEGMSEHPLRAGDVVYVAPDDIHQFRNTGQAPMRFLCLVPHIPPGTPVTLAPECEAVAKRNP